MTEQLSTMPRPAAPPVAQPVPACVRLAELVCADDALLQREFDSIIAAAFPMAADRPLPRPPRPQASPSAAVNGPTRTAAPPGAVGGQRQQVPQRVFARERSPPPQPTGGNGLCS
jgi:hypothetical protein